MTRALRAKAKDFGSDTNRIIEVKQGGKKPSLWTVNPEHTPRKPPPSKPRNYAHVERRKLDQLYKDRKELKVMIVESEFTIIVSSISQKKPRTDDCQYFK